MCDEDDEQHEAFEGHWITGPVLVRAQVMRERGRRVDETLRWLPTEGVVRALTVTPYSL